jgi:hypothetical protein
MDYELVSDRNIPEPSFYHHRVYIMPGEIVKGESVVLSGMCSAGYWLYHRVVKDT